MFDPPSRLECRTIGGPAAPNAVQACSAQAIASEASNLALLSTLPSRQELRGRRDGWPRVRMGATWPAPHSHRLRQLAAARKYARELREIRAKEFALHFRAGPFPSLAEGPELPLANYAPPRLAPRSRDSLTRSDMPSTQLPLDDSSVSPGSLYPALQIRRRRSRQIVALTSPGVAPPREKDCVNDQTVHSFSTTFSFGARSTLRLSRQRSRIHPAAVRHSSGRPRKIIADDQIAIACALVRPGPKNAPAHEAASLQYLHCSRHTD